MCFLCGCVGGVINEQLIAVIIRTHNDTCGDVLNSGKVTVNVACFSLLRVGVGRGLSSQRS